MGAVFVCVEGADFDRRRVILELKWCFSSGTQHVLELGWANLRMWEISS